MASPRMRLATSDKATARDDAVVYSILPIHPEAHLFEVTCTVAHPDPAGQRFALPAWIPGSYMIREFAKNIVAIAAHAKGKPVLLNKLDKHTWQATPCVGPLTLTCTVHAWDLSVRCAHLDTTHGFFNGTAVFLRVLGHEEHPHIVDVRRPGGATYRNWRVATSLSELKAKRYGFGTYQAANYDELVDHPVEMGTFELGHFMACGTRHDVVITGRVPNLDMERLCRDMQKICEAQIRFFDKNGKAPFGRYVFLTMALGEGYGGLEHRASTALICARTDLPAASARVASDARSDTRSDAYRTFLGLVSHEYFHSWNVKRIKPAAFAPYDFDRENYTSLLWLFEGFTSYYDDLFLVRSGLMSTDQYLNALAKTITGVLRASSHKKQSVAASSFDAWIKYYRQDDNAPNAVVSYYAKGSLVALALDLHLRRASGGMKSLDDVMRVLWQRYGRHFYPDGRSGLSEGEFPAIVREATGIDVARQVRAWTQSTDDLPLKALFAAFGVDLVLNPEHERPSLGVKLVQANDASRIASVHDGSAAQGAGLAAGDTLIALDGVRVTSRNLDTLLARYRIDDRVRIHAFRRDELMVFDVRLGSEPPASCTLGLRKPEAHGKEFDPAWRNAWLTGKRSGNPPASASENPRSGRHPSA